MLSITPYSVTYLHIASGTTKPAGREQCTNLIVQLFDSPLRGSKRVALAIILRLAAHDIDIV